APYAAAYVAPDGDRRPFNYVVMEPPQSGLRFTVKCLSSEARCTGGVLDRFEVAYPALPTSAQSRCS
ncbi:MAG TPA: hypothetical protein VFQ35_15250, partial [Polyangiaceae bacterium]|nr:hypothetical protein [Polyangiaceae bacterium]